MRKHASTCRLDEERSNGDLKVPGVRPVHPTSIVRYPIVNSGTDPAKRGRTRQ